MLRRSSQSAEDRPLDDPRRPPPGPPPSRRISRFFDPYRSRPIRAGGIVPVPGAEAEVETRRPVPSGGLHRLAERPFRLVPAAAPERVDAARKGGRRGPSAGGVAAPGQNLVNPDRTGLPRKQEISHRPGQEAVQTRRHFVGGEDARPELPVEP